jgi:hypothetical protein
MHVMLACVVFAGQGCLLSGLHEQVWGWVPLELPDPFASLCCWVCTTWALFFLSTLVSFFLVGGLQQAGTHAWP